MKVRVVARDSRISGIFKERLRVPIVGCHLRLCARVRQAHRRLEASAPVMALGTIGPAVLAWGKTMRAVMALAVALRKWRVSE